MIQTGSIPGTMSGLWQWVGYMLLQVPGKDKPDKVPINPHTCRGASSKNPGTWGSIDEARAVIGQTGSCKRNGETVSGAISGIGFMFAAGGGIVGVDLDHCIENGQLNPWASDWLERFNSYTEISPSGTGVHFFCLGHLPGRGIKRKAGEMYDQARFFTCTGDSYGPVRPLRDAQDAINALYAELTAGDTAADDTPTVSCRKPVQLTDDELLGKALADEKRSRFPDGREGATFAELFSGDKSRYGSASEADQALVNKLAFWTNGDPERIDRLFRQSELYRAKWDEIHGADTYGGLTIQTALRNMQQGYDPEEYRKQQSAQAFTPAIIRPLSTVAPKPVDWLWYPYIPRRKLTLVNADPGAGKTYLLLKLMSIVSTGGLFYGESGDIRRKPGNVLLQNAEDGMADTLVPRLLGMNPDMSRIHNIDEQDQGLTFDDPRIEEALEALYPALAVFDPIQEYLGGTTDMHRANEVRPTMSRLGRLAEKYGPALMLVMHFSKTTKVSTFYRALGSIDFVAAARSMLTLVQDPDNPGGRLMCHDKSSLAPAGPSIRFHIDPKNGGVVFDGYSPLSADEALAKLQGKQNRPAPTLEDVMSALHEELTRAGYITKERAEGIRIETGCSERTLYNAKKAIRLQSVSKGKDMDRKTWWIPEGVDRASFLEAH